MTHVSFESPLPLRKQSVTTNWLRRWQMWLAGGAVILLGASLVLFTGHKPLATGAAADAAPQAQKQSVTVIAATSRQLTDQLLVTGSLSAWDELPLGTELQDLAITEVLVDEGDHVKKGQLLAQLDSRVLAAQFEQNKAAVSRAIATVGMQEAQIKEAEAAVREADANLKRATELVKANAMSIQTADARLTAAAAAGAKIASARAALIVANADLKLAAAQRDASAAQLDQTQIRAPVDGTISKRLAKLGAVVPGGAQELFRLVRDDLIELNAEVPERDLPKIAAGQTVKVTSDDMPGQIVEGKVRLVSPLVDQQSRLGLVHIRLPVSAQLRSGMFVRGDIMVGSGDKLVVPEAAVVFRSSKPYVFLTQDDGKVKMQPIVTGDRQDGLVQVISGIQAGQNVVLAGAGYLKDGDLVQITSSDEALSPPPTPGAG